MSERNGSREGLTVITDKLLDASAGRGGEGIVALTTRVHFTGDESLEIPASTTNGHHLESVVVDLRGRGHHGLSGRNISRLAVFKAVTPGEESPEEQADSPGEESPKRQIEERRIELALPRQSGMPRDHEHYLLDGSGSPVSYAGVDLNGYASPSDTPATSELYPNGTQALGELLQSVLDDPELFQQNGQSPQEVQ